MPHEHQMTPDLERCLQNCVSCATHCEQTLTHCLMMGGKHADAHHIGLLMDCAEMCRTSAKFMMHLSHYHHRTCDVCAEICEACAKDCEQLADGDRTMLACAEACRRCVESCRRMAMSTAH